MYDVPHDRLHQLFAVGGFIIAMLSATMVIDRCHEAEMRRIEADERASIATAAVERLSEAVARQAALGRSVSETADPAVAATRLAEFWRLNEATEQLKARVDGAIVDLRKHSELQRHYANMRMLWLWLGGISAAAGVAVSAAGFLCWRRHEGRRQPNEAQRRR